MMCCRVAAGRFGVPRHLSSFRGDWMRTARGKTGWSVVNGGFLANMQKSCRSLMDFFLFSPLEVGRIEGRISGSVDGLRSMLYGSFLFPFSIGFGFV